MLPLRSVRALGTAGLLAAALAALPSLEWCPLADWVARACDSAVNCTDPAATACAVETQDACGAGPTGATPAACPRASWPACDPEADPLPIGDRLWCVQPPVIALVERADALPAPEPFALFAELAAPPALSPPASVVRAGFAPEARPPALREAHAPPQPRAPPAA